MNKKLKLDKINENAFSPREMENIKGGEPGWPFCFVNCDCSGGYPVIRSENRKSNRKDSSKS